MSDPAWPDGAAGALSLSFDNLGEAAELELGAMSAEAPLGGHFTVETVLPRLLDRLGDHDLSATFFVEGMNAELYPEALAAIDAAGQEVAFHAWRHEQWGGLSAAAQEENLARGLAALARLGLEVDGMRPPGGELGPGGLEAMREAGLRYCSPAGEGAEARDGIALLPFQWPHVDAGCVLPGLGPPREPAEFLAFLEDELRSLARDGGFLAIVLHPFMLDWLGEERLDGLLGTISEASASGDVWVARCGEIAERLLSAT